MDEVDDYLIVDKYKNIQHLNRSAEKTLKKFKGKTYCYINASTRIAAKYR